jgi:hypothetical protein
MAEKSKSLLSIGAALASLSGLSVQGAEAKIAVVNDDANTPAKQALDSAKLPANAHFQVGEDLLGFVMTKQADGTIVAQHSSHASHGSHASHASSR